MEVGCDQNERVLHSRDVEAEPAGIGGQYSLVVGFVQDYIPVSVVHSNVCTQKFDSTKLPLNTIAPREHTTGGLVIEKIMSHLDALMAKILGSNHLLLVFPQEGKRKNSEC